MSEAFLRTALVFHPVTDVVARGVVVAAVDVFESGAVEVDRDDRALAGVSDPVDVGAVAVGNREDHPQETVSEADPTNRFPADAWRLSGHLRWGRPGRAR